MDIHSVAMQCKEAAILMSALSGPVKNAALKNIIRVLKDGSGRIVEANAQDLEQARKDKLDAPLMKRLKFDGLKLAEVCDGIESLIKLDDPVGKTLSAKELDKGLRLYKVSRPIGVIGVIFESRPDALVQIAALCLKSGNAALLKGGREALRTNQVLSSLILKAGQESGLPEGWLGLLETRDHVDQMLKLEKAVDLIIPRGSNEFVRYIMDHTNIPVLGHADGICHLYMDRFADAAMAVKLAVDSKCQYVAVCNAVETLLVHEAVAEEILPVLKKALEAKGVEMVGCEKTREIIEVGAATEEDWKTEYLDLKVS
ncbi:MAG: glutamate-5-semialdehyde dehydrogenase, partial [Desulfobacteraceae bacterium]|nr:glutamate-5-semialdehyde dehydrogenase [Desulfobacteraceae bacterium]